MKRNKKSKHSYHVTVQELHEDTKIGRALRDYDPHVEVWRFRCQRDKGTKSLYGFKINNTHFLITLFNMLGFSVLEMTKGNLIFLYVVRSFSPLRSMRDFRTRQRQLLLIVSAMVDGEIKKEYLATIKEHLFPFANRLVKLWTKEKNIPILSKDVFKCANKEEVKEFRGRYDSPIETQRPQLELWHIDESPFKVKVFNTIRRFPGSWLSFQQLESAFADLFNIDDYLFTFSALCAKSLKSLGEDFGITEKNKFYMFSNKLYKKNITKRKNKKYDFNEVFEKFSDYWISFSELMRLTGSSNEEFCAREIQKLIHKGYLDVSVNGLYKRKIPEVKSLNLPHNQNEILKAVCKAGGKVTKAYLDLLFPGRTKEIESSIRLLIEKGIMKKDQGSYEVNDKGLGDLENDKQESTCETDKYGNKFWRNKQDQLHRLDGPAIEYANGNKYWYQNNKLHRLDGPACEYANGTKEYYVEGKEYTEYMTIGKHGNKRWYNDKGQLHRLDGPAIELSNGDKHWCQNGKKHRLNGPAVITSGGTKKWYQNGKLHRLDGPAIEYTNGTKQWYQDGKCHKTGGAAVEHSNGDKEWYQNDKLHRTDGPAVEWSNGTKKWYQNGKLHRLDGPAIEHSNGAKSWYQNGKYHRTDGPAIEFSNGKKEYYVEGKYYTEESFTKEFGEVSTMEINKYGTKRWYNKKGQLHRLDGPAIEYANGTKEWYQNDKLHRLDGPAVECADAYKAWYKNGQLHRLDGPAIEYSDGDKSYYVEGKKYTEEDFTKKFGEVKEEVKEGESKDNGEYMVIDKYGHKRWYNEEGKLHRLDGPAIEFANGTKQWYQNGKKHRLDGPAIVTLNDVRVWLQNDNIHRLDGPAIEYPNGRKSYYIEGVQYSEADFFNKDSLEKKIDEQETVRWFNKQGEMHREDGAAVEYGNGTKFWYQNDVLHRLDGPAVEYSHGDKQYWVEGKQYSEEDFTKKFGEVKEQESTCKVDKYGHKRWRNKNNKLHRLDGPAIEFANGDKYWYQNNKLHRLDGPAIEYSDGDKEYWVEDKKYSEEDFTKFFGEVKKSIKEKERVLNNGEWVLMLYSNNSYLRPAIVIPRCGVDENIYCVDQSDPKISIYFSDYIVDSELKEVKYKPHIHAPAPDACIWPSEYLIRSDPDKLKDDIWKIFKELQDTQPLLRKPNQIFMNDRVQLIENLKKEKLDRINHNIYHVVKHIEIGDIFKVKGIGVSKESSEEDLIWINPFENKNSKENKHSKTKIALPKHLFMKTWLSEDDYKEAMTENEANASKCRWNLEFLEKVADQVLNVLESSPNVWLSLDDIANTINDKIKSEELSTVAVRAALDLYIEEDHTIGVIRKPNTRYFMLDPNYRSLLREEYDVFRLMQKKPNRELYFDYFLSNLNYNKEKIQAALDEIVARTNLCVETKDEGNITVYCFKKDDYEAKREYKSIKSSSNVDTLNYLTIKVSPIEKTILEFLIQKEDYQTASDISDCVWKADKRVYQEDIDEAIVSLEDKGVILCKDKPLSFKIADCFAGWGHERNGVVDTLYVVESNIKEPTNKKKELQINDIEWMVINYIYNQEEERVNARDILNHLNLEGVDANMYIITTALTILRDLNIVKDYHSGLMTKAPEMPSPDTDMAYVNAKLDAWKKTKKERSKPRWGLTEAFEMIYDGTPFDELYLIGNHGKYTFEGVKNLQESYV